MNNEQAMKVGKEAFDRLVVQTGGRFTNKEFVIAMAALLQAGYNKALKDVASEIPLARDFSSLERRLREMKV